MEPPYGKTAKIAADPYAPPSSHFTDTITPTGGSPRGIVVAWERMRLRYNLILLLPGLIVLIVYMAGNGLPVIVALIGSAMTALAANVCYFLGAISEFFVCALFNTSEHPAYRKTAYFAGIALSLAFFATVYLPAALMGF